MRAEIAKVEDGFDNLTWPHFDHFIWPHLSLLFNPVDLAASGFASKAITSFVIPASAKSERRGARAGAAPISA